MSSQIVMAPVSLPGGVEVSGEVLAGAFLAGGVFAGAFLVGASVPVMATGAVAKAVQKMVDQRVAVAVKEAAAEQAKIADWLAWQERQRQQSITLVETHAALLKTQECLLADGLSVRRADQANQASTAQGYASLNAASRKDAALYLQAIVKILDEAPADFRADAGSPHQRLLAQAERLKGRLASSKLPRPEELTAFHDAVNLTISGYLDATSKNIETTKAMTARLANLMQAIGLCRQLATSSERQTGIDGLHAQLLVLLAKPAIPAGQVELLEKRLAVILKALDAKLIQAAFRTTLASALDRHLQAMGFGASEPFPTDEGQPVLSTVMTTEEGKCLQIAIQADNRLAFEMLPSKSVGKQQMSASDREHFRAQEKVWCQKEMPELLRRLTQDGFSYEVQFARDAPESRLQIAVVESVEEILASQTKAASQKEKAVSDSQPDQHVENVRRQHLQQSKRGERH